MKTEASLFSWRSRFVYIWFSSAVLLKNNWNIDLKTIHVCFLFLLKRNKCNWTEVTRRNIFLSSEAVWLIQSDRPSSVLVIMFILTLVHICRPIADEKKIMALVRRSTGRRHHWTSLTAFVSRARLSKALDVHGSPCGETREVGKFRAGQIDRLISKRL